MPKVSVILTVCNQENFLRDAVSSVLQQSFTDLELIVVDHGSDDHSSQILRSFGDPRLRTVRQEKSGAAAARNQGFKLSSGVYVNFLDANDYLGPEKLARQVEILDSSSEIGLVFCDFQLVDSEAHPLGDLTIRAGLRPFSGNLLASLLAGGFMPLHAALMRREIFEQAGMFQENPELAGSEAFDLWLRIAAEGHRAIFVDARDAYCRLQGAHPFLDWNQNSLQRRQALAQVIRKYPERIASSLEAIQSIQQDLYAASQFHQAMLKDKDAELARLQAQLELAETKILGAEERVKELSERTRRQDAQIQHLTGETEKLMQLLKEMAFERSRAGQRIAELLEAQAEDRQRIASLEERLGQKSRKMARIQRGLETLGNEFAPVRRNGQTPGEELHTAQDSVDYLVAWATRQAQHMRELAAWTRTLEVRNQTLQIRLEELSRALADSNRAREQLAHALSSGGLGVRFRKGLHNLLDALQRIIPESVRTAVRPIYLAIYRIFFPHGKPGAPIPVAPAATPAKAGAPPIPAEPPALKAPAADARPLLPLVKPTLSAGDLPKVSVVLPVWNHARFVRDSIQTVFAQTYQNLELIVVDDGSEDDLEAALRPFAGDHRLRVVRRPHEGLPQALSAGFRYATGSLFTWTSADNLMKPHMLSVLVDFMLRNPDVALTYGDMDLIDDFDEPLFNSDYRIASQRPGKTNELSLPHSVETLGLTPDNFVGGCFMYRSHIGRAIGDYDSALLGTEDYDYWLRISLIGNIRHVDTDECLYTYRVHQDSLSAKHTKKIGRNAHELIAYHKERWRFHKQRFDVLVQLHTDGPDWIRTILLLAEVLSDEGHRVTLARSQEESEAWLRSSACASPAVKRMIISTNPADPCLDDPGAFMFLAHDNPLPVGDPGLTWFLCQSAEQALDLPADVQHNWTLIPTMRFHYGQELTLCRKARDHRMIPWDFRDFREPLALYIGPLDDGIIDWELLERLIRLHPDWTFLFIASSETYAADPRSRLTPHASVHYLGSKKVDEWAAYLSRAALLLLPFRDSEYAASYVWDVMVAYLLAGRPVVATEVLKRAAFQDAPNTFLVSQENMTTVARQALDAPLDLTLTDRYLDTKSPQFLARYLVGIANSRLHYHMSRLNAKAASPMTRGRELERRCLIETATLDDGELDKVVADMASSLPSGGWHASLAITDPDGQAGVQCRRTGIPVHSINHDRKAFESLLKPDHPGLLVAYSSSLGAPIAWRLGIPVVSVVGDSCIWSNREIDKQIEEMDLYVTRYVAVSAKAKEYFCQKYRINPDKCVVIANGINIAEYETISTDPPLITRETLGLSSNDVVLVNPASLIGTEAQVHAIKALEGASAGCPGLRLLIVGPVADAKYTAEVAGLIEECGLGGRVLICQDTGRLADYYRLADGLLLTSLTQGWSRAMTEAMYFELPLIVTDVGGAREVIENGDIGILVPPAYTDPLELCSENLWHYCTNRSPRNLDALTAALVNFHDHLDSWKERGKAGRQKVLAMYDHREIARRYAKLFSDIVHRHYGSFAVGSQRL